MHTLLLTLLVFTLVGINKITCQSEYGNIFPIPLNVSNDNDADFVYCPEENGAYVYQKNCSLFYMCNHGIHTIYSCIDGHFFSPTTRRCQYVPIEKKGSCERIRQKMLNPLTQLVRNTEFFNHRKSATSKCTQVGIYPDILDCSLFHYCHTNNHHEIFKCPNGLNFDPKTFLCASPQLVNCQYEPAIKTEDNRETICRDYAPGTYLPMANRFDEYIICDDHGKSISMKCNSGYIYNALTTACENGPCTFDSTLCQNEGQCIDDPTIEKGFKCLCPNQFGGEFCEKSVTFEITTEQISVSIKTHSDQTTYEEITLRRSNSNNQQEFESTIKMVFIVVIMLISIITFVSIIFGIIIFIRWIFNRTTKIVGNWDLLHNESSV